MIVSVLIGLAGGLGLVGLLLTLAPPAPVDLAAAVTRLHHGSTHGPQQQRIPTRLLEATAHRAAQARHPWLGLPHADLALLDRTPRRYLAQRARWAMATAGPACVATLVLPLPAVAAVTLVLVAGPAGSLLPVWRTREAATAARSEARRALAVYLDLVAQERAAGRAPAHALREAAEASPHWTFSRIASTVTYAQRTGTTSWHALAELGHRWQLDELVQIADLAATANDGAAIHTALTTHAASLRQSTLAAEKTEANSRSDRLTLPATLLMAGFLILILYPTVSRLLTF